jgi:hypothetical protein
MRAPLTLTVMDHLNLSGRDSNVLAPVRDVFTSRYTGTHSSSPGSVILSGCRPSRIASTISGASSVSRSKRGT